MKKNLLILGLVLKVWWCPRPECSGIFLGYITAHYYDGDRVCMKVKLEDGTISLVRSDDIETEPVFKKVKR